MNPTQFYAVDVSEHMEAPFYAFGYEHALNLAHATGSKYIAKVRIMPNGAFEYYDCDGI
jgi:hypothetical protein